MTINPSSCELYLPGHQTHWIQANKSNENDQPRVMVTVVAVHDDGIFEIEGAEVRLTLWHHDPVRLRKALLPDGRAEWLPRYHVLHPIVSGRFNVASPAERELCRARG